MFKDNLEQILAVLFNVKKEADGIGWMTAAEISKELRDNCGISLHWKTVDTALRKRKDLVVRRKRLRRWQFSIMSQGEELVKKPSSSIIVIDPSEAIQAVVSLHDFLSSMKGDVRICDPYLDAVTLEHLDSCSSDSPVFILTKNIKDSGKLRRLLSAAATSGQRIEIRRAVSNHLHDRYIIDSTSMLILGASLNGFGKKQCFIIKTGHDVRNTMLRHFSDSWEHSTTWPS